jgi:hypothetical protein
VSDREGREPGFEVIDVESPLPRSSLNSVERYVEVRTGSRAGFEPGEITIEYPPEHLGWVRPDTLRVFRIDPEQRTWELVEDSGPLDRGAVRARVDRPGVYGVAGLPGHPAVLETVLRASRLPAEPPPERPGGWLVPICLQILCGPNPERWGGGGPLVPPGGFGGTACELCADVRPPKNRLPEFQLVDPGKLQPHERRPPRPGEVGDLGRPAQLGEPGRAYALIVDGWIGVGTQYGNPGVRMPYSLEVFELDPPRSIAYYPLGLGWADSLAVSSTADRFYVTNVTGPEVAVFDGSGAPVGTVGLPLLTPGWYLDCALSPDDTTLFVTTAYGLVVIETAGLSIVDRRVHLRLALGCRGLARRRHGRGRWDERPPRVRRRQPRLEPRGGSRRALRRVRSRAAGPELAGRNHVRRRPDQRGHQLGADGARRAARRLRLPVRPRHR